MPATQSSTAGGTNTCSILSLLLAILGWNLLPVIGFIGAIIFARTAKRQLKQTDNTQDGLGLAKAGEIIGWLGIACTVLIIAAAIMLVPALISPTVINLPASAG